jgi:hypothetical protein
MVEQRPSCCCWTLSSQSNDDDDDAIVLAAVAVPPVQCSDETQCMPLFVRVAIVRVLHGVQTLGTPVQWQRQQQ